MYCIALTSPALKGGVTKSLHVPRTNVAAPTHPILTNLSSALPTTISIFLYFSVPTCDQGSDLLKIRIERSDPSTFLTQHPITMTLVAILLPWLSFILRGRILTGILCLILQITIIGWIPAAIWAVVSLQNARDDRRNRRLIRAIERSR